MPRLLLAALAALLVAPASGAQTYALERSNVAAGATSVLSSGGDYALGSTVGGSAAYAYPASGPYGGAAGFWAGLSPAGVVQPTGTPIVSVPPASGVARPTEAFDLPVVVGTAATPAADLFGVSFDLTWDPTRVALVAVAPPEPATPGGLGDCNGDAFADIFTLNQVTGASVQYSVTRRADRCASGVSGEITVVTLSFQVLAAAPAGASAFTISNATATERSGTPIALTPQASSVTVQAVEIVWPGDTNNDGATVSTVDIAPLAAFFGLTGVAREEAQQGITWGVRFASPWAYAGPQPPAPAYDLAHTDANGDGTIDQADLLAIGVNIGRMPERASRVATRRAEAGAPGTARAATTPAAASPAPAALSAATATLFVEPMAAGETVDVRLDLSADATDHVLGVTTLWTVPAPLAVQSVEPGDWIDDGQLLALDAWTDSTRTLDVGLFRRRGAETLSGTGAAMTLRLVAEADLTAPAELALARVQYGTTAGATADVPTDRVALTLPRATSGDEAGTMPFGLAPPAPNPAVGRVALTFHLAQAAENAQLAIYDALGREVAQVAQGAREAGEHTVALDASRLAPGVYIVRLTSGGQYASRSLTIVR